MDSALLPQAAMVRVHHFFARAGQRLESASGGGTENNPTEWQSSTIFPHWSHVPFDGGAMSDFGRDALNCRRSRSRADASLRLSLYPLVFGIDGAFTSMGASVALIHAAVRSDRVSDIPSGGRGGGGQVHPEGALGALGSM